MSIGDNSTNEWRKEPYDRAAAQQYAARAAREAGYKSPLRRLLGRLRPHRQQPGGDPQSNLGTNDDQAI